MLYVIKKKDEFHIVDQASSYIFRGSREECEAWLNSKPATPEEAQARQKKFLEESRRGQGWRKGQKGVLTSKPK
jgi:hypothetical protein